MGNQESNRVVFVCTGNYYRSRLAEILFNDYSLKLGAPWEAESRGLMENTRMKGLSPDAIAYLKIKGFDYPEAFDRAPIALKVEDFENARLFVIMNRKEHEPMMKRKYGQIPDMLAKQDRLRYLNVFDVPLRRPLMSRLSGKDLGIDQPSESSGEHIDFAVRTILTELHSV